MASPLPILLGLGALILVASGSGSSSEPAAKSEAYKAGYADGYKDAAAKKPAKTYEQAKMSPEAVASGNASDYADGYLVGRVDGAVAATKSGGGGGDAAVYSCKTADAKRSLIDYQKALIAAKSMTASNTKTGKSNADGICGPTTIAAIADFQSKNGLTVTKVIDKATAPLLEKLMTGSAREPKTYQLVVPTDWGLFGPFAKNVFLHVGPGLPEGEYRAKVTAESSESFNRYLITGVIENPGGIDIQAGDKGILFTKRADGTWI